MKPQAQKATREQTRAYNTRLILKTIYDQDRISRADVARLTHLTRPTVSDAVADLMALDLLEEVGQGPSAGGKPPILLSVVPDARHVIGIDLASGEFRGAVVNLRGEIRQRISLPLRGRDGDAALAVVYELIDTLTSAARDSSHALLGIGIGTPGWMDPVNGVVRQAVNLHWQDLPLRRLLSERYDLPVYVANDCQVAALAEFTFGEGQGAENLVLVKVEHGIGAGIVLNSRLYHGDSFGAGEIGHVVVADNGLRCRCGNLGCLETVASDRALVERAQAIAAGDPQSALHRFAADPARIGLAEIGQAVEAGDPAACQAVAEMGHYLGVALANLVGVLSVQRIVFAGTATCFGPAFLDAVRDEMLTRSLALVARETRVSASRIGADIVILGASSLVLTKELGLFAPLMEGF